MRKDELHTYFNWSCNQLAGDPVEVDGFLRHNMGTIKKVAAELLVELEYEPAPIYRGIIMTESDLTELKPHKNLTYLSCTESIDVARIFANPNHEMAFMIPYRLGTHDLHGYITAAYTPKIEEVLFHYNFLEILPYVDALRRIRNIDASRIHHQQEVTILQPALPLKLYKYDPTVKHPTNTMGNSVEQRKG